VARDLILLIDTSGSMGGEPIEQARRVALALVDTLGERDSLEMIDFNWQARRWREQPEKVTAEVKADARRWLGALVAGGGTEMRDGIMAALRPLRATGQRQVIVISDGLIGFEHEIVAAVVNDLPLGCRVHTVGVGSAVNRSLTAPCARAGRGVEAIIGIGEDPERTARRIVARTSAPLVVELELSGSALVEHCPKRLPDLYAGAPALISAKLRASGGELLITGRTEDGRWQQRIAVEATPHGTGSSAVTALFAREQVEDLETEHAAAPEERRVLDARIERLALDYQISSRLTSWIAVSDVATADPSEPTRHETIPQELPYGTAVAGMGLRPAQPMMVMRALSYASGAMPPMAMGPPPPAMAPSPGRGAPPPPGPAMAPPARRGAPPPPASVALGAPKRKASFVADRIGGTLDRLFGDGTLLGKIVLQRDGEITIEITSEQAMRWAPEHARLTLADGSVIDVTISVTRTSKHADVPAGRTVRLTLHHEGALAAAPALVELTNDGDTITIRL
jgi:Ca-activated chloride channel family protein